MRIAICFNGQLRTAVHAAPQIRKWIGSLFNQCDFFIHTWDSNTYKSGQPNLEKCLKILANINLSNHSRNRQVEVPVTNNELNFIKNFYKPKGFIVDCYEETSEYWVKYWEKNYLQQFNLKNAPGNYWNPLYYSFYRAIEMKRAYEKLNSFTYDLVIKMRPDVSYPLIDGKMPIDGCTTYKASSLETEITHFLKDTTKFYANGISKAPNLINAEDFWYGNSKVMDYASKHWISNLSESELKMLQYCFENNIETIVTQNTTLAFHRIVTSECPAEDFILINLIEQLFNNYDFLNIQETQLDTIWKDKLSKALIEYKVVDIFCKVLGCNYTIGD